MNRNRIVGGALGLVLAAGTVGWAVGATVTSPAEAAARASAPEASLITVAVDERLLSADIIARGSIGFDDPVSLSVSGGTADAESKPVVTRVAAEGDELREGAVALEVAGRPVILLQGDLPVFRDLRPGAKGLDVLQLEESLVRQGFLDRADQVWDNRTGAAIQGLYAAAGHEAPAASDSERDALKSAREGVRIAAQSLADAERAIREAGGASGSELLEAKAAVAAAEEALALAITARTSAINAAASASTSANAAHANATAAVAVAQGRLTQAQTTTHPDTGVPATPLELVELEAAVSAAQLEEADRASDASAALDNITFVTESEDVAVATAERDVDIAEARLAEATSPGDTTFLKRARDDARRALSEANEALVRIEASVGTWLPSGEIIFVKNLPVQVAQVSVERGDILSGTFMTVSGADIVMTVGMQERDAQRLSVGDAVLIDEPELLPEPITATIAEIPEASQSGRIQVLVDVPGLPRELTGANVRVIIPVESTSGEVLVVPAAALSSVANGDTRVEVEDPDSPGQTRFVTVVTGLAADGVVEVRPVDGELRAGDRVVVGQADVGPVGGDEPDPDDTPEAEDESEPTD